MIVESQIDKMLRKILSTKVVSTVKRVILNGVSGRKSVPQTAGANYITFPVIVSDDISKEVAMDVAKSAEVKIAYDIQRILGRKISDKAQDVKYDKVLEYLPIDTKTGAFDTKNMRIADEHLDGLDAEFEVKEEAMNYIREAVHRVDVQYSEAHSKVLKERGSNPTNIDIEIKYINDKDDIQTTTFTMGVNAVPRYVERGKLRMKFSSYDTNRFYKKFVRLTNKEESFVKDFLVDYDLMKQQAKEAVKDNSVFKEIERKKLHKEMGVNRYPFTIFLISKSMVRKLEDSERMDIYDETDMLMDKLLSMGFYVYDHDTDIMEVKYDGDERFTQYPFDEIAKDVSRYEKQLQKMVRLNQGR